MPPLSQPSINPTFAARKKTTPLKPSIPKGTRDFLPNQVRKRQYIFDVIRRAFVRYGYQPIETPVMENLSTLTGKYGEEGDKLLFKVLNNGDFLAKADGTALDNRDSNGVLSSISKRGLRYDLTVPFARYVVMHQNDLSFPFKRYAIEPVWRADRPQRGRYQEFYQCDADVVGSKALLYEAELTELFDEVFAQLKVPVEIKVNNRKILAGMAEVTGASDRFLPMVVTIDKLDKIGWEKVAAELRNMDFDDDAVQTIQTILDAQSIDELEPVFANSAEGQRGIAELREVFDYLDETINKVVFDPTLARGLSYYTGCIFEVKALGVKMGSIGGGGRYDDLTGIFGMKDMSGVGISFGAERIYDVMEELDLFPADTTRDLQVLLIAFDDATHRYAYTQLRQLRAAGISAELYPEPAKMKKQMKYANARNVPFVGLIGSREMEAGEIALKNMETGEQEAMTTAALATKLGA